MVVHALMVWALLSALLPEAAQAWTNAHVRNVRAVVELDEAAEAWVRLDLTVTVHGGWLGALELSGFAPTLQLESSGPARFRTESGELLAPHVRADEDAIVLSFPRELAPRRGTHTVSLRLRASFAEQLGRQDPGSDRLTLQFGLPGWEAGLETAVVIWRGPFALEAEADATVAREVRRERTADGTAVRFTRFHLPREVPWTVGVRAARSDLSAFRPPSTVRVAASQTRLPRRRATGCLLGGAIFASALGAAASKRRQARRAGRIPLRWPVWPWAREGAALALAAYGAYLWPIGLRGALSCYGLSCALLFELSRAPRHPLPFGRFVPVPPGVIAAARSKLTLLLRSGCDASLVWAALAVGAAVSLWLATPFDLSADPWGLGLLCMLLSWTAALPGRGERPVEEGARELLRVAEQTALVDVALGLFWYVVPGRSPLAPRLRVLPRCPQPGLLRCEVLVEGRRQAFPCVVSVVVEGGSPVDRWLRQAPVAARRLASAGGLRAAYLFSGPDVNEVLEVLFSHLAERSQKAVTPAREVAA